MSYGLHAHFINVLENFNEGLRYSLWVHYLASTQSPEFQPQHKGYSITAVDQESFQNFHSVCLLNLLVKMEWIFSYSFHLGNHTCICSICCYVDNLVCFRLNVTKCPAYSDISNRHVYCSMWGLLSQSSPRIQTPSLSSCLHTHFLIPPR